MPRNSNAGMLTLNTNADAVMDEVIVDPIDALEQHPQKQHGEHRGGDVQGFEENGQHAVDNLG